MFVCACVRVCVCGGHTDLTEEANLLQLLPQVLHLPPHGEAGVVGGHLLPGAACECWKTTVAVGRHVTMTTIQTSRPRRRCEQWRGELHSLWYISTLRRQNVLPIHMTLYGPYVQLYIPLQKYRERQGTFLCYWCSLKTFGFKIKR